MTISPVFIVGVGRSGTTLIRQMLNSHSQIAVPYESHFITDYMDRLDDYGDLGVRENLMQLITDICNEKILSSWDFSPTPDEVSRRLNGKSLRDVVDAFFSVYATHHGKVFWGDKSDYLDRQHKILQLFPDAKIIHIVRDGRDVANSVMKMTWGPNNIKDAGNWWGSYVRLGHCMGSMLGPNQYMTLRYEDLVINSEIELNRICEFIGVEFESTMLEFYKDSVKYIPKNLLHQHYNADQPPKANRVFAWKSEMKKIDALIFQEEASEVLKSFEYDILECNYSRFRLFVRKVRLILGV